MDRPAAQVAALVSLSPRRSPYASPSSHARFSSCVCRRGKSPADKANPSATKFINLDRVNALDSQPAHLRPQGEVKGLFKALEIKDGTTLNIICENGDTLSMKMNDGTPPAAKRAADWAKMIRAFAS